MWLLHRRKEGQVEWVVAPEETHEPGWEYMFLPPED